MAGTLITDLVDPQALVQLKELDDKMTALRNSYTQTAKDLVNGIKINVEVTGDLDKLSQVVTTQYQKANQTAQQMNSVMQEQSKIVANTTNTISRQLMEQEKLNKAQREATTINREAMDIADNILGTREQNNIRLARLTKSIDENKKAQDRLKKSYEMGSVTEEAYATRMGNLMAQNRELATAKKELNRILDNEQKMMNSAEGSYGNLSLQLERLKMAYKQMNDEEKKGAEGSAIEAEIQNLDAHLKDLAADMGEFQRNVGNYAIANKSVKQELKELTGQMAQMLADGVDPTSEEFLKLAERAGTLKDAMGDAKATIKAYANDTQTFTSVISVLETGMAAWQTYAGALNAFGIETGDAEKAMQQMMGIMSMLNGIQKISTELTTNGTGAYRAYHAILKLLGIERAKNVAAASAEAVAEEANTVATEANTVADTAQVAATTAEATATEAATVATGAQTAAVAAQTTATASATAATIALRAALLALGIGAVIALISALVSVVDDYCEETDKAKEKTKALAEAQKSAKEKAYEAAGQLSYYATVVANFNGTADDEKDLIKELNEKMGDSIGHYKTLAQWKKALISISEYYIDVLKWEAEAQEYFSRYAKAKADGDKEAADDWLDRAVTTKTLATKQQRVVDKMIKNLGGTKEAPTSKTSTPKSTSKSSTSKVSTGKSAAEVKAETKKEMDELIAESDDMLNEWSARMAKNAIKITQVIGSADEDALEVQKELIKSYYAQLEDTIETENKKEIAEQEKKYDTLIAKAKKNKIDTTELENAKTNTLTAIGNELTNKIVANRQERDDLLKKMDEDYIKQVEKATAAETVLRNEAYMNDLRNLDQEKQDAIENAKANGKKLADIEKEFAKKRADIDYKYKTDTFDAQINALQELMSKEELTDEQRQKYEEELTKAKMGLQDLVTKHHADTMKEQEQAEADAAAKRKAAHEQRMRQTEDWMNFASDALSNISDLSSAIFSGQIQKVEEEQDANSEAYDKRIEEIENLADKGAITEEEAELRKREAKAASEAKEEELAKKKAKLQYKQALVEKANNISQIGIQTALAIMKAAPNWVQVGLVSALGAIQLATAIAQPIKAYADGTKGTPHMGGIAVVGDGGQPEVVMAGGRYYLTPDKPTLIDLPKGAEVYPSIDVFSRAICDLPTFNGNIPSMPPVVVNNDYSELNKTMNRSIEENTKMLGVINRQIRRNAYMAKYEAYKKSRL